LVERKSVDEMIVKLFLLFCFVIVGLSFFDPNIFDKLYFYSEFKFRKLQYKLNKAKEFWKLYLTWCSVFNKESEKRFKDKYDEHFS
jgi:hypothetical protein